MDKIHYEFPWNENGIVKEQYQKSNYKVVDNPDATYNKAVIFLSSNGIYFPNTEEVFIQRILNEDRYDYEYTSRNKIIKKYFKRVIFCRDVYKQWYVTGINQKYNTMDSLCELLKKITDGYDVTVMGNSAGGYAAIIVGEYLKAERIISDCGQFKICELYRDNPLLNKYSQDKTRNRYFDVVKYANRISDKIFYFFPIYSEEDKNQFAYISKQNLNIHVFAFYGKSHGITIPRVTIPYLLTIDHDRLCKLNDKYKHRVVRPNIWAKEFLDSSDYGIYLINSIHKRIAKSFNKIIKKKKR